MRTSAYAAAVQVGLLAFAVACGKERPASGEAARQEPPPAREEAPAAPSGLFGAGTIAGRVTFAGTPPGNPPIDMSEEPQCRDDYPAAPQQQIVVVSPNRTLANVFVYVKAGLPADAQYSPPATPVGIDQKGCRYHPRVLGIMVGQEMEIRNSDPLLHNVKALARANRPFNISQPTAGMSTTRSFRTPEVMLPIECNVHGWMHAYAGVLPHPFFATTGENGAFTIGRLPPGTYTIEAWHERYGAQTATVTVRGEETQTVEFTYRAT